MELLTITNQILYSIEVSKERSRTKYNYSTFLLALQSIDTLHLSKGQVDSLVICIQYLKQKKDSISAISSQTWIDTKEYESTNLTAILNPIQLKTLLEIKNADKSLTSANNDWEEMEERDLTSELDKEQELKKLKAYYLERNNIYDQYAHDSKKRSQLLSVLYRSKPKALIMLIKARRTPNNDTQQKNLKW
jgi:hypothetical protein